MAYKGSAAVTKGFVERYGYDTITATGDGDFDNPIVSIGSAFN